MELNHQQCSNGGAAASGRSYNNNKSEFPIKLYAMLQLADNDMFEFAHSVSWLPHGRAFRIHHPDKFMKEVVPLFFNQTKIRSFNRQLNLWGFLRIGIGSDQVWYNDNFLRGKPECMKNMIRTKIKGVKSTVGQDVRLPNLDELPPLPIHDLPPPEVVQVMENVIQLKISPPVCTRSAPRPSSSIVNNESLPLMNVNTMPTMVSLPRTENKAVPSVKDFVPHSSIMATNNDEYAPLPFSRKVSETEDTCPALPYHQYQNDMLTQQVNSTLSSIRRMRQQSSLTQEQSQIEMESNSNCLLSSNDDNLNLYPDHSPNHHVSTFKNSFEPPSFMNNDDESCDEFASFIEGAIQQI